jgi:hypothetical protein
MDGSHSSAVDRASRYKKFVLFLAGAWNVSGRTGTFISGLTNTDKGILENG